MLKNNCNYFSCALLLFCGTAQVRPGPYVERMHRYNYLAMKLAAAIAAAAVFTAPFAAPVLGVDQVVKLYLCQTEHELDLITGWENSDPARYREATKNGTIMPLDVARERASFMVSTDRIACDAENRLTVEKQAGGKSAGMAVVEGPGLDAYCPRTIAKHGHPCR
jgi:hypothetical protein